MWYQTRSTNKLKAWTVQGLMRGGITISGKFQELCDTVKSLESSTWMCRVRVDSA